MAIESVLHMNGGNGESSYANNSSFQKSVLLKTKPVIEDSIKDMYINGGLPECLKIADLGCSSGPNTLFLVSEIIDIFHGLCKQHSHKVPEFQVFLNDLPENDFNSIFKSLSFYFDKLKKEKGELFGPTFILAMPGSFYQRLFPSKSLHFVHSSYSVHWLSQVPEGLENNKRNIYMSKTSPPNVLEAYSKQFQRDFFNFIHLRSEEIIAGGCMVLTFIGRSLEDPTCQDCCCPWDLLTKSLLDLEAEGLVKEADIDSFNMPYYTPYKDEVESIIQKEGSFSIKRLEVFEETLVDVMNHSENDREYMSEKNTIIAIFAAKGMRAVTEPILASHFGDSIMDSLFGRYTKNVVDYMSMKSTMPFNIVISLTKK